MRTAADFVAAMHKRLPGLIDDAAAESFIVLAEAECNRRLRCREMIVRAVAEIDTGYTVTPADLLEVVNLTLEGEAARPLRAVTPDRADALRRDLRGGPVRYYCMSGAEIELLPNPTGTPRVELEYYARIPGLLANETSWLAERAPDALLMGALAHAASYVFDATRAGFFRGEFERAIETLNGDAERARFGASPLVVRQRRTYG